MKKLIVFDLDGTLTQSKQPLDIEMTNLLRKLLSTTYVGITGGASFNQLAKQLSAVLEYPNLLSKLLLFPTNGACLYRYIDGTWQQKYSHLLTPTDKNRIFSSFDKALRKIHYQNPPKTYGPILEDRDSQITFSALGQNAPLKAKESWRQTSDQRPEIKTALEKYLPNFDVVIAGITSIDVIAKNVNKGMAINYAQKILNLSEDEVVFVGDALFIGGNDYLAKRSGVETVNINGPDETKMFITKFLQHGQASAE